MYGKLKTLVKIRFASKVIIFQDTLQHQDAINFGYGRQKHLELQGCMLYAYGWFAKQFVK
jgi:hypothetical protein